MMVAKISTQHAEKVEKIQEEFNKKLNDLNEMEKDLRD